jgi:hypothetical protein
VLLPWIEKFTAPSTSTAPSTIRPRTTAALT